MNTLLSLYGYGLFWLVMPIAVLGMELSSAPKKDFSSLYKHFGIEGLQRAPKGVRGIIASEIVGDGGWWYEQASLPDLRTAMLASRGTIKVATSSSERELGEVFLLKKSEHNVLMSLRETIYFERRRFTEDSTVTVVLPFSGNIISGQQPLIISTDMNVGYRGWDFVEAIVSLGNVIKVGVCSDGDTIMLWDYNKDRGRQNAIHLFCSILNRAIAFHPESSMIATTYGKNIAVWDLKGNLIAERYNDHLIDRFAFHPQGHIIAVSSPHKICLWSLMGNKIRELAIDGSLSHLVFSPKGDMIAGIDADDNLVLWQKHEKPTLKQVLFRQVLKDYFVACIEAKKKPTIYSSADDLPSWMAAKFKLDKTELSMVWESFPPKLQEGIIKTVFFRATEIYSLQCKQRAKKMQQYHELSRKVKSGLRIRNTPF